MTPFVRLKRHEDQRIRDGHLWVFSNEIQEMLAPPAPGGLVEVRDVGGRFIGIGFHNPHSLIAVRIVSCDEGDRGTLAMDADFFTARLKKALDLRTMLFPSAVSYRLVHGEADMLPGLVIDRYNDYFSIQTVSLGMDIHLQTIADVLESLFHPTGIIERNDSALRELEGLAQRKEVLRGTSAPTEVEENGIRYLINPLEGQKTGFFLDQRQNRTAIGRFAKGKTVLDCFCNEGGFALHAAAAGASSVEAIDISESAVQRASANAALNGLDKTIRWKTGDVFDYLDKASGDGKTYDLVILDPPSFTRSRKNVPAAKQGYRQLHQKAFSVLNSGAILATASCSHHIFEETFLETVQAGAQKAGKRVAQLEWYGASPDHPVLPGMPETKYLKFGIFYVL